MDEQKTIILNLPYQTDPRVDVDDLILNTLGAALGYLIFVACNHIRRYYYGKKI